MRAICTSPETTFALQVEQTPPLQAYGSSLRTFNAASSTRSSRRMVKLDERPSSRMVTSVPPDDSSGRRTGSGGASTWNSSVCTDDSGRPRATSTALASTTRPYGPQRNHSSIASPGTMLSSSRPSRSASIRPESSGDSPCSRESTCTRCNRAGYRSFRSANSSANITVLAVRLPYTRVKVLAGSTTRAVATSDSTGVMPEPATTAP